VSGFIVFIIMVVILYVIIRFLASDEINETNNISKSNIQKTLERNQFDNETIIYQSKLYSYPYTKLSLNIEEEVINVIIVDVGISNTIVKTIDFNSIIDIAIIKNPETIANTSAGNRNVGGTLEGGHLFGGSGEVVGQ